MNFAEFQTIRESLLRERPDICDCAETNLYRAIARLAPPPTAEPAQQVHRCHLAGEWCARFGFPPEASRRAFISCGVRDSLARLFAVCAAENILVWLPRDNYPVYHELARQAGCRTAEFSTLPEPSWPDSAPCGREIMVVTNPLKPLGRHLSDDEVVILETWLAASSQRRLFLDAVYTFSTQFDTTTLRLLTTGQTVLLHSLTKGWLHPRLFGIALVPEQDAPMLRLPFRKDPPPQINLARARECLGIYAATPGAVAEALREARFTMLQHPAASGLGELSGPWAPGYFLPVRSYWRDLLYSLGILGLPASTFGSACEDITILSTLSFAR